MPPDRQGSQQQRAMDSGKGSGRRVDFLVRVREWAERRPLNLLLVLIPSHRSPDFSLFAFTDLFALLFPPSRANLTLILENNHSVPVFLVVYCLSLDALNALTR